MQKIDGFNIGNEFCFPFSRTFAWKTITNARCEKSLMIVFSNQLQLDITDRRNILIMGNKSCIQYRKLLYQQEI